MKSNCHFYCVFLWGVCGPVLRGVHGPGVSVFGSPQGQQKSSEWKKVFWCLELVPIGLLVELVRVLDQYRRAGQGLKTSKLEFFSGSLFPAALKLHIKKLWWSSLHLFLYPTVQIYEINIFLSIFPGYITIAQPPVGLLAQYWWERCTGITKIQAFFSQLHA